MKCLNMDVLSKITVLCIILLMFFAIISIIMQRINIWQGILVIFAVVILCAVLLAIPDPHQKGFDL